MQDDKKQPRRRSGDGPKIVGLIVMALLVTACVWVFQELHRDNDALNCASSGRTNCDSLDK